MGMIKGRQNAEGQVTVSVVCSCGYEMSLVGNVTECRCGLNVTGTEENEGSSPNDEEIEE